MTNIAWRNLGHERLRFALSIGGVAFAVMLMLIVRGLYEGILTQATEYARTVDADLWISQAGTPNNLVQSMSVLPGSLGDRLGEVDGVDAAFPLVTRPVTFEHRGRQVDLFLVGVAGDGAAGWPESVRREGALPRPGEILVARVFAKLHGLRVGDALDLGDVDLRVAGIVRGGNALVYQYGWAHLDDVAQVFGSQRTVSHFLVHTPEGAGGRVADAIGKEVPDVQVRTPATLAAAEAEHLGEGFRPMLFVLVVIALLVGGATIGLIIYTATIERRREYAVLKAIGFSNGRLYALVFQQAAIAAGAGFAAGCGLAVAVAWFAETVQPVFVATIGWRDLGLTALAAALMAFLASFVPARPLMRLHPAEAFRA